MSFACSTDFADHIDAMGLSAAQRDLLADIGDAGLRETVRDLIVNQRFRRDYWIRGAERLSAADRTEALRRERVIAVTHQLELPLKLRAALALSQTGPGETAYGSVLEILGDGKVRSLGQLEQALRPKGISLDQVVEAVILIASCGLIQAAQDDAVTALVRPRTDRLNAHLTERARTSDDVHDLASPVTGGGIHVGRCAAAFPGRTPRAAKHGRTNGRGPPRKPSPSSPRADLIVEAKTFADEMLPTLRSLQIV